MITKYHFKIAFIAAVVAAFFGITLGMELTCMIPIVFIVIIAMGLDNSKNDKPFSKLLLDDVLPPVVGGGIIWICFLLKLWMN